MAKKDDGKLCAILAWFFPIGLIWWAVDEKMKKNLFVKHHIKQSIVLVFFSFIGNTILGFIPILGWLAMIPFGIATFVLWIMGLIAAINGEEKELPLIGQFAEKLNF